MKSRYVYVGVGILIIALIGALFIAFSNKQTSSNSQPEATSTAYVTDEDTLLLSNLGLSAIAPYSASTGMSGDILISQNALREYDTMGLKGFYVFGDTLSENRKNPNFEFSSLAKGTKIVAATDGIVSFIKEQPESSDYEIFLQPKENSIWTVGYDHITTVSVKTGDPVKAGDILGEASLQNNGLHRFELQVNKDLNGKTTHVCPSSILTANVKTALLDDLLAMQNAWESFSGKNNLYNQEGQSPVGCLVETLTPEQAEGR